MSETIDSEIKNIKFNILSKAFSELGWNIQKEIGQDEIIYFLNQRAKDGRFDINILNKLFEVIGIEEYNKITVEEFINAYIQLEEDLNQNSIEFKKRMLEEQNSYDLYQEQCYKYKNEKLNSDGFSENAKLSMEITDIEIKKKLRNVNDVILYLIYNKQKEELKFEYSNDIINFNNAFYEFKSTSKQDHFELILKGIKNNEENEIFEIGKKIFPLEEIISQEEYSVQITLPEKGNYDEPAAYINSKIILHWSDYKFYEEKKKNCESKLRKLNETSLKANQFLLKIKEIYGLPSNNLNSEPTQASKDNYYTFDGIQNNDSFSEKNLNHFYNIERNKKDNDSIKIENINNYNNNDNQFGIGYEEAMSGYDNENKLKTDNRNSYKNLKAVWLIKLLSLLCILFGLFNSLQRADYSSEIVGIICFIYIFFVDKKNLAIKSKNFWRLFLLVFGALMFDLFWLYINFDFMGSRVDNRGPFDSAIEKLSYFTTGCNAIIKSCLAILMFAQYKLNY